MTARSVRKHLALVPRPCYSVQHLQNCCHETKSRPWVNTYIHSLPCSTCEPASQRESASGLSTASAVMPVVRFTCCKQLSKLPIRCFLQDLPTPNIIFGAWSVGQECMMSMFANECLLQDRPTLSANESTCGNIWVTSLSVLGWKGLEATSFLPAPAKLLAERSSCWVFTYIHSAACSKCEPASQRKWLTRI